MELKGKIALVCGASGNLGLPLIESLVEEGVFVYGQHRSTIPSKSISKSKNVQWIECNLSNPNSASELVEKVIVKAGKLDLLINLIGAFQQKDLSQTSSWEWRQIIDSNLNLSFDLAQAALPQLRKSGSGRILFFGYAGATNPKAKISLLPYQIAKSGLVLLTRGLAKSEAKNHILVNCLSPGVSEASDYHPKTAEPLPLNRPATRGEISEAAIFLLRSDYLTGQNLELDGAWQA
ncbi:MAG: SDR family oxidoreductase [Candidatus Caenarcaniphilales bacterium]|nr:SDR family oxidoreductase [Candidatus Caenarcaniphilales bacterium]